MPEEYTPKNTPGPFVILKDQCIACGAPEAEAPDLMAHDDEAGSCYFRRQPTTPEETDRAVRAVQVSCCEAVVYRGTDPEIQRRIEPYLANSRPPKDETEDPASDALDRDRES